MLSPVLALRAATVGNALVLAAVESPPSLAPWLQGGGSAAAVAGLVYVARMIVKGDLVPRSVAARETEMAAAIRIQAEREKKHLEMLEANVTAMVQYAKVCQDMARALGQVSALLRDSNAREDRHGPRE